MYNTYTYTNIHIYKHTHIQHISVTHTIIQHTDGAHSTIALPHPHHTSWWESEWTSTSQAPILPGKNSQKSDCDYIHYTT